MKTLFASFTFAALLAIFGLVISLQIGVWKECRADHSFWYCVNLVSGK